MNIISTTNRSRCINGILIYEAIHLVEQFGMYAVIVFTRTFGQIEERRAAVDRETTDYDIAVGFYEECGGKMQEDNRNETLD